jgi:hypothetical protein
MAVIRGQSYIVDFVAWDLANNAPKTGDAANITVRISKDGGTLTAATNSPVEVDATNAPGLYRITLTAGEMDANTIEVVPKSTTANTYCQTVTVLTERGRVDTTLSSRATAADVWGYSSRTLTSFGTLVSDIWSHSSRTLTSFGTLVADIWSHSSRTLTSFGTLVSDIWNYSTRTLTGFGTLASDTASAVWSYVIEGGQSALAWLRLMGAALFGKRVVSGSTYTHRDWADTKDRIVGTVDSSGNRTITTRDGS